MQLSNRINSVAESGSLMMAARCQELRAQGVDVISMTLGEPDFMTPDHIKQAAIKAVEDNFSKYGPVPGFPALRQAIAKSLNGQFEASEILVSTGAKQVLYNAVMAVINPGDEVIIPTPSWVSYVEMVKLAEGKNVIVPTTPESNWKMTAEQLQQALTPKTRMIILCSPNNPTGSVYSHDELEAIVKVLEQYPEVCILSDEIYQPIRYIDNVTSMASFPSILDRLVIINGISKAYAMTGYRIGFMATKNKALWNACKRLQGHSTSCACTVAQKAAELAYTGDQMCVEQMRVAFERRRDLIMNLVAEIKDVKCSRPDGAFYIFPDLSAYYDKLAKHNGVEKVASREMTEYLLQEGHVACVAGIDFGEDRCVRLSYATSDELICEAMHRIKLALEKL